MSKTVEKTTLNVEIKVAADLYVSESGGVRFVTTLYPSEQDGWCYDPDFCLEDMVEEMIGAYEDECAPAVLHIAANEFSRLSDRLRSVADRMDDRLSLMDEDADDMDTYEREED